MFDFLKARAPQREDFRIDVQGASLVINHPLKIVVLYEYDSSMPEGRYDELEKHLNKQGYFLQIIVAASGVPMTTSAVIQYNEER